MTGEEALFIESGIREGVFILLFISVWRAILGPLTSSWAGSGECRAIKGNQVCTFPSCRKAPPAVRFGCSPQIAGLVWSGKWSRREAKGHRLSYSTYKSRVVRVACSETGILFSSGVRI